MPGLLRRWQDVGRQAATRPGGGSRTKAEKHQLQLAAAELPSEGGAHKWRGGGGVEGRTFQSRIKIEVVGALEFAAAAICCISCCSSEASLERDTAFSVAPLSSTV